MTGQNADMTDNCTGTGSLGLFVVTSESWWASRNAFADYMRSDDHRRSHARIPHGAARPTLIALHRYALIAR